MEWNKEEMGQEERRTNYHRYLRAHRAINAQHLLLDDLIAGFRIRSTWLRACRVSLSGIV